MTDRPIIFSAPMIRALLEGRKTQTRRLKTSPLMNCSFGDRLWVREAFSADCDDEECATCIFYRATSLPSARSWKPSIHMPRWASRLTLHVEAVCVERLQGITEQDAIAEGAERLSMDDDGKFYQEPSGSFRTGFAGLWSHLHGPNSWDANPWIVALTFRVERANIDAKREAA